MKRTAIILAIAAAGFASISQAAPKDDTWYLGAKLGWSQYHDTGKAFGNPAVSNEHTHPSDLGAGAYLGYQANPYVGFELGYDWLGRMPYKADGADINTGSLKSHGVQLSAKLGYPITDNFDIYTRLGGMAWRADSSWDDKTGGGKVTTTNHDTGISPLTAVGVEYALTRNVATRLDYQWVYNIGDDETVGARPDNGLLSVGVAYRFGQDEAKPPVVAPVAPIVETKRFVLKSDVMFNFNKDTLKDEGKEALNQMVAELSALYPTDGAVVVKGYTDHLGTDQYNQKLSERRAKSVVNYMVSQGFPSNKISALGMGEADPVTGNDCNNVKPRKALIDCLAPDRRVEIEVTGTVDVVSNQ